MDRHVLRGFVWPFLILTGVAVGLSMMMEILRSIDEYLRASDSAVEAVGRLLWSYLLKAPTFVIPMVPMTTLVAGAFAIAHLESHNELTAMKASGVSVHRVLMPVFLAAALMGLCGAAVQEFVVPVVELRLMPLMKEWSGKSHNLVALRREVPDEGTFYFAQYNVVDHSLTTIQLVFKDTETNVFAESGSRREGGWLLRNVQIKSKNQDLRHEDRWLWRTRLTAREFDVEVLPVEARSLGTLLDMVRRRPTEATLRVALYSRFVYPLQGVLLLLVAVPLVLSHESVRKSRLFGAGLSILLGGAFYVATFLCSHLGAGGDLPPLLGAWLPVAIFGALGLFLMDSIPT